jgi:hypothetical protein
MADRRHRRALVFVLVLFGEPFERIGQRWLGCAFEKEP